MNDARQTPEDPVIKHVREQHNVEPPAHLDAFILNAAQREAPARQSNLWQRWLDNCRKPRWQVAFASLVGVALMLSLVQRPPEPQAQFDYAPAAKPAAPMARKQAPEAFAAPAGAFSGPAPIVDMTAPMQSEAILVDEAQFSQRAAAPANGLDAQLREVLRLRESGQSQAADSLFNNLHKRYPDADLDARLEKIQKN